MYKEHFGFKELPFTLAPDPAYYFNTNGHHQALNVLLVALRSGEGFVKITGEVGTGKTLLCRKLLNQLRGPVLSAYIPNPLLSPAQLFRAVAEELDMKVPAKAASYNLLQALQQRLIELAQQGRRVVVLIDEAQAMPDPTLEALRLLSNLETEKRKLLQIVLFGQPELDERLAAPGLRQLRQRIAFSYRLPPLSAEAVEGYVNCRLRAAGWSGPPLFQPGALRLLHRASQGIPRLVNVLSHKALMAAYGHGEKWVRKERVREAVKDTEGIRLPASARWRWLLPLLAMLLAAEAVLLGWLSQGAA